MKRSLMLSVGILAATTALAGGGPTPLTTIRVASGLTQPLFVTWPPNDPTRMFVVEKVSGTQQGRIRIVDMTTQPGTILPTPFLTLSVSTGSEQGALCMAFHPNYASNGKFYVSYTNTSGNSVIAQYTVSANPNVADPSSAVQVMTLAQPFTNHNGGWIGFGPDGYLYCAFGDGGSGGDPGNRAQNINILLGKMLRIDVDGDDFPADSTRNYAIPPDNPFAGATPGLDEIWAYGLRNPWRNSFDRETGDMWIGDVGQNTWEEIDFAPAGVGGRNYGWRCYEGNAAFNTSGCGAASNYVFPVHVYGRSLGFSTTGGYVYRGNAICDLRGTYFFADYGTSRIWSFRYTGSNNPPVTDRTSQLAPGGGLSIASPASFGEDLFGELYICDINGGEVFKIVPAVAGAECPPPIAPGDMNCDGVISVADIGPFVLALTDPAGYEAQYPDCDIDAADLNDDGVISTSDIGPFVALLTGA
jgi:glucose/arabinose dehydrogenase